MDTMSISQYFEKASREQLIEWRRIVLESIYNSNSVNESAPEILKTIDFYLSVMDVSHPPMEFIGDDQDHGPSYERIH